ncbi:hypothetical protein [Sinomonas atrocyanea]
MSTHVSVNVVTSLNVKSHDDPDEKRRPDKSEIDLVTVGDYTIGRLTFAPAGAGRSASSRWSEPTAARTTTWATAWQAPSRST